MTNAMKNELPNLKHLPYGGAWSIHDSETVEYVSLSEPAPKPDVKKFLYDYAHWMKQGHTLDGIDAYKHLAFANGTTEVFDNDIIAVDCNSLTNDLFYTAPCPSNGGLFQLFYTMDAQQDMVFKIVSSQGRLVKSAFVQSQIGMNVWTFKDALAPGV